MTQLFDGRSTSTMTQQRQIKEEHQFLFTPNIAVDIETIIFDNRMLSHSGGHLKMWWSS
jgi:hypothetical protein